MPLPSIVMPAAAPDWLYTPHQVELATPYARVQFTAGEARMRRVTVGTARRVQAELMLTPAAALAVHNWFEDELEAGVLPFAARLLAPDGTREWWHTRFASPPEWTGVHATGGPMWRLAATLRLEGEPDDTGPE